MPDKNTRAQTARVNALLKQARSGATAKAPKTFFNFLKLYYQSAGAAELEAADDKSLVAAAWRHWRLARQRKPGQRLVEVFQPELKRDGWQQARCVVMTVSNDMPFLVDSLTLALHEFSPTVQWQLHPVMRVQRDANGLITAVAPLTGRGQGSAESLVQLQTDPLPQADCKRLQKSIENLLRDLDAVVGDFADMQAVTHGIIEELQQAPPGTDAQQIDEARAFMQWLVDDRFTFLGYCRRTLKRGKRGDTYVSDKGAGLGLLRDALPKRDPEGYVAPAAELDKYARSKRVLVISRGNSRSWIHHPEYMDVISIKRYNDKGELTGLHRFIGLFSMEAYASSPRQIPVLRQKLVTVSGRAGLRPGSHAAKNFNQILETLPRDELFQASEDELYEAASTILELRESQQLRLTVRRDRYRRYYSCMVYLRRDRYSRGVRDRISAILSETLKTGAPEVRTEFLRRGLARIYYILPTPDCGPRPKVDKARLERVLTEATHTWQERFIGVIVKELGEEQAAEAVARFRDRLPRAYSATVTPQRALIDLRAMMSLEEDGMRLQLEPGEDGLVLRVYTHNQSIALSDLLPSLENFGLKVISQQPYESDTDQGHYELQVLELGGIVLPDRDPHQACRRFEAAFTECWEGRVENDGFNRLVLAAGLDARQVALLRAVCKYLLQTGLPFSQAYMEQLLTEHVDITRRLFDLFVLRFDPDYSSSGKDLAAARRRALQRREAGLLAALDAVASLDADRVLRAFMAVVRATERSNYFQVDANGQPKPWISLKIASRRMTELPEPRPLYETFVYSPKVEGIHLRGGMVARGGLRWSDRREDFRTEVLGLMKAQMVKNTVIVPAGAKGGFVVKGGPAPSDREAWLANGIECYKTFLSGLLDITDNLKANKIVPPPRVVRHDSDDPYLVVAADKGTATFSDIANSVSEAYGHWLGDAFASGGSAGYDHKKMGITARGAWELVKRHFRELGKDIQNEDFTAVGIGDMGGDVFGNGMLLSKHIQLVAAFNHLHIFLDPNPDAAASYKERERLFKMPRSSWADYNSKLISAGGGLFERSAKRINLSKQVQERLDIQADSLTPTELISAILKSPVELLWNGGIGTYVKASSESHGEVGDRANDGLRVDGRDLRCKVVGEGGNLGLTQAGRIEFALNGGQINTDAIDNSAGVDSSDREVNIKIPLNGLLLDGKLKRAPRDKLLASMTDDVAELVLRTNYLQGQAISAMARTAAARLDEHASLMGTLERSGLLNRAIEGLPDEEQINERRNRGIGLSRPELSVLLSYSKLSLYEDVVKSKLPAESCLEAELLDYFPPELTKRHAPVLKKHRLRHEILATLLTNQIVNRMGAPFCHRVAEEQGVDRTSVVRAFYAASQIYDSESIWAGIEALDNQIPADLQLGMCERVSGLVKHAVGWLLYEDSGNLGATIERFRPGVTELGTRLEQVMSPVYRKEWTDSVASLREAEVPLTTAQKLANTKVMGSALDIVRLAEESGQSVKDVATAYFAVGERFGIPWLLSAVIGLKVDGRWQALARVTLRDDCYRLHRILTGKVLAQPGRTPAQRLANWMDAHQRQIDFAQRRLKELQSAEATDFMALTVAMRELRKLRLLKAG